MALHYSQFKRRSEEHTNQWTSYSDLFLGLSVVFLLLYVTSSLRSGTSGLQQQIEKERLTQRVQDLESQLKAYNTIRQTYIDDSGQAEAENYKGLLSKLDLLKEEAKSEKEKLKQAALQNEQKEGALNQYQQLVRNMINANVLAKAKLKRKDLVIGQKNEKIGELEDQVQEQEQKISENETQMAKIQSDYEKKAKDLKWAFHNQKLTKAAYEKRLAAARSEKVSELGRLEKLNEEYKAELSASSEKLSGVSKELHATKSQLSEAERERQGLAESLATTKGKMAATQTQLAKALSEANARKNIAAEIQKGFAKVGVKADVNAETGDVTLNFGDNYFDSGNSDLKEGMISVLKKAFPVYATSLMDNPKLKKKVSSVEIVGFASPTYKGKMVDPNSLGGDDRKAVDYNLDLSYARARSIFQYLFDKNRMSYQHQQELLPLVKVTGRSFLAEAKNLRGITSQSQKEFCQKFDCKKAQKVLIRFELGD